MPNIALCSRLKEERERLGYSQTAFAELVGASKRSQIGWEQGRSFPDASVLEVWAGYGVDVLYVLTGIKSSEGWRPKVPREVGERLVRTMGISSKWLATGEGPMFLTGEDAEKETELQRRLDVVKEAAQLADLEGLTKDERARAHMLVYGLMMKDAVMARDALTQIAEQEMALIDCYRAATDEGRKAIEATAKALARESKNDDN